MAYVDTRDAKRNYPALVLVGAIELAVGYALIMGLAAKFVPKIDTPPKVTHIPLDPPKTEPETKPTARPDEHFTALRPVVPEPAPKNPFENSGPIGLASSGPGEAGGAGSGEIGGVTFPTPSPSPLYPVKPARPKGNPAQWVSTNDYPQSMIRAEAEGTVRFELEIDRTGRVTTCTVTGSSGFAPLDQTACDKLSRRARFEPASDGTGALVAGTYRGAVRWQLPKE